MPVRTNTHLETADLRVLAFLAQSGVDPVENDLISSFVSITKVWQNLNRVPEAWKAETRKLPEEDGEDSLTRLRLVRVPPHQLPHQRQCVHRTPLV